MRNLAGLQLADSHLGGKAPGSKVLVSPALSILIWVDAESPREVTPKNSRSEYLIISRRANEGA
jgi:hypothetical protein